MTSEQDIRSFTFPIATVLCVAPNGRATKVVPCYTPEGIVDAVDTANERDSVRVVYWGTKRA